MARPTENKVRQTLLLPSAANWSLRRPPRLDRPEAVAWCRLLSKCSCRCLCIGGLVRHYARSLLCSGRHTRGQSAHPKIPLEKFSPSGGVSSGILPSRGILKNIILCRHKTFNPPEGLIPCMPCRGKTYKIPLALFSISTPAGFNLVENSGGKT